MPDSRVVAKPSQERDASAPHVSRRKLVERCCLVALAIFVVAYVVAYSSKSIAAYTTGNTLFDLATFEQGFWNATKGTLFFYSLEGEMSRLGRHFSPIFIPLVPLYALHRDPATLLVLQTLALGLAAVPLYLFARLRLASPVAALAVSALYLASPATHDVNIVNEFHEIAPLPSPCSSSASMPSRRGSGASTRRRRFSC
ncbi:MAG: DUF2079 domain-containing protein [Chloroflexi bacterium]|nr:DUF2079 domain-containing protein [Chloroflexota bacterium]